MFAAEPRGPANNGVVLDDAAIAQLHLVADDGEGADANILSQVAPRAKRWPGDRCTECMGIGCPGIGALIGLLHSRRGRGLHRLEINHLAHKRGFGGQFAVHGGAALSLQKPPRQASTSISMRNWSPGITGRRKRALSMDTK